MISIVISSANKQQLSDVKANIEHTIGVEFEVLSFDNAGAKKGICEIYNEGIARSRYDTICFMHEDLILHRENWGQVVLDLFNGNPKLGLIGVAGSQYKAMTPSSWFTWLDEYNRFNMVQRYKFNELETRVVYKNPNKEKLAKVNGIDGVWFCTHKRVTDEIAFDDQLLKGFHGYDVDFSLNVGQKWDVAVTYDVLLEHFSEGNYDKMWLESILLVHKKWKDHLPKGGEYLSREDAFECEKKAFVFFIDQMWIAGYSKMKMWRILWQSNISRYFGWKLFFKLSEYIRGKK